MEISETYKNILLDEIAFVRQKITEESDISKKIYYYSAIYGMTRRILNLNYDHQLQFIDYIFYTTYQTISNRLNIIRSGDLTIQFQTSFFDDLIYCLEQLEEKIRNDEDTYTVLEKVSNLASLIDGNGYYLSQKGIQTFKRD